MAEQRPSSVERRLAAVLIADMVGYSRLMGIDEEGTLTRLKALRAALIDPSIAGHNGRLVKTVGDGLLVEFASAVDAARCALEIQHGLAERNSGAAPDQRLEFRIGINVGDIIVEGDDIYGDGINIAARLEALAEPGGIRVSSTVRDHVLDKLAVAFDDLGEHSVKNIARPVRVYRLRPGGAEGSPPAAAPLPAGPAPVEPAEPSASRRLSLIVLPFANLSGDPEQDYFVDGLTDDLTTELSRLPDAFVIARNTAFTFKGKAIDVRQVGRELGIRFMLEGSVRKAGQRIRVNVQLIDAESGAHVWADRFDREIVDLFELQDAITLELASTLGLQLVEAESRRGRRSTRPDAIDFEMRARAALNRGASVVNYREALDLFDQALRLDPDNVPALACSAWVLAASILALCSTARDDDLKRAEALAERAVAVDPHHPWCHFAIGVVRRLQGSLDLAIAALEQAIRLNPNMAPAHSQVGFAKILLGRSDDALPHFTEAIRLSPRDPLLFLGYIGTGLARFLRGEDALAIEALRKSAALNPASPPTQMFLAAAYAMAGRSNEAQAAIAAYLTANPSARTLAALRARPGSNDPAYLAQCERLLEGLRRAGLPES